MSEQPASHRPLEHTADVGVEVEAPSREALFAEAAVALCDTLATASGVLPRIERQLDLVAADDELLLVDFLSEILFLFETERLIFASARVWLEERRGDATMPRAVALRAVLRGERYDEARHPLRSLVKAVTFHGLSVRLEGERWRARILFDV